MPAFLVNSLKYTIKKKGGKEGRRKRGKEKGRKGRKKGGRERKDKTASSCSSTSDRLNPVSRVNRYRKA